MYKILLTYLFVLNSALGICQTPLNLAFRLLTREDGLSNNNIFVLYKDSRGFLWLGSMNGLNRFDGINVKTYTPENSSIKGININQIIEDREGNLWVGTEVGLEFYDRKKDAFQSIALPKNCEKQALTVPYAVDDKDRIWVEIPCSDKICLFIYDPNLKKYSLVSDDLGDLISPNRNPPFKEIKIVYAGRKDGWGLDKFTIANDKVSKIEHFLNTKNQPFQLKNITQYILAENDSTVWITGTLLGLIKLNPLSHQVEQFNKFENRTLLLLNRGAIYQNLLIFGSNEGLYVFDKLKKQFVQQIQHSFNANTIASNLIEIPYVDEENNLFLSLLGYGIDFTNLKRVIAEQWLNSDETFRMSIPDNNITFIKQRGEETWAKLMEGSTIVLDNQGKVLKRYKNFTPLLNDSQNRFWLCDSSTLFVMNSSKNYQQKIQFQVLRRKLDWNTKMLELSQGQYLISSEAGLFVFNENKNSLEPITDFNREQTIFSSPIFYDTFSKQLFISTNWWKSFYVVEQELGTWKIKRKFSLPFQVFAISPSRSTNKLWLGTNKGLVFFDTKTFSYQLISKKNGLPDNSVTDIVEEKNGDYWLVTNLGISFYNAAKKTFRNFSSKDGAYSNEYDWNCAFKLSDNRIVFGGTHGITVIHPNAIKSDEEQSKIQITQLFVNEVPITHNFNVGESKEINLNPEQNSFALELVGIDFTFPQKNKIQYQLKGYDKQWITVKNHSIVRYSNLNDGTYEFMAQTVNEDGKASFPMRTLTVVVHAPFYRTTWFRFLLVMGLIGLSYLLYRLRTTQIKEDTRKKEEIKRIKMEAEINALRSQMNPHFIFNCLNTVDSYILLNKTDEASEFLHKFSKLIRRILENSRQEFIPLEEDLQTLDLYIKLEQERSHPQFLYQISVDEQLQNTAYFIPTMLIQPFVENAILHGLRHKRDEIGELLIKIMKENSSSSKNSLLIQIVDNGIGREASKKINISKNFAKKSMGIKLTEERIEKLNLIYDNIAYIKVMDRNEINTKGTIVEIGLPLLTQENLLNKN